jgi:MYXO-CTERM domain-containing protein
MNQLMRRVMLAAAVLSLMASTAGGARAGTIVSFSYSGRGGPDDEGFFTTGTGSFSFASGLSTVGLSDLTSFAFSLEENNPPTPLNIANFGLTDLTSFSASVGPGETLTSLTLQTSAVQGSDQTTYPREFSISSLNPPSAFTHLDFFGFSVFLTSGTVTISSVSVPEPSTFTLAVLGALIVAGGWFRRRRAGAVCGRFSVDHHDHAPGRRVA